MGTGAIVLLALGGLVAALGLLVVFVILTASAHARETQTGQATIDARTIQPVAENYRHEHPYECPTCESLRAAHELSARSSIVDPWGTPYRIDCRGEKVYVVSLGPDKLPSTDDDIRVSSTP